MMIEDLRRCFSLSCHNYNVFFLKTYFWRDAQDKKSENKICKVFFLLSQGGQ